MNSPIIAKATEALEELSQDPAARDLARRREDQLRLYRMELSEAKKAGLKLGREEGREEGEAKGREEGLLTAIRAVCANAQVEVSVERAVWLEGLKPSELTDVLNALLSTRGWPVGH